MPWKRIFFIDKMWLKYLAIRPLNMTGNMGLAELTIPLISLILKLILRNAREVLYVELTQT